MSKYLSTAKPISEINEDKDELTASLVSFNALKATEYVYQPESKGEQERPGASAPVAVGTTDRPQESCQCKQSKRFANTQIARRELEQSQGEPHPGDPGHDGIDGTNPSSERR